MSIHYHCLCWEQEGSHVEKGEWSLALTDKGFGAEGLMRKPGSTLWGDLPTPLLQGMVQCLLGLVESLGLLPSRELWLCLTRSPAMVFNREPPM